MPGGFLSENDIKEEGGDTSEDQASNAARSADHGMSSSKYDFLKRKQNEQLGNDLVDGDLRVDAWNLNYMKRKKKHKKKKVAKNTKKKMDQLQSIYDVDARTLAGLQHGHSLQ